MKALLLSGGLLLLGLTSCICGPTDEPEPEPAICPISICANAGPVVKTVQQAVGKVVYNATLQQYAIVVTPPTITGAMDVGLPCNELPTAFRVDGLAVVFDGIYREKPGAPRADVAEYYLEVTKLDAK